MDRVVEGRRRWLSALALPALVLTAAAQPAYAQSSPPRYSIVDLSGDLGGAGWQLNNNGQIAGWIFVGGNAHAAIYSNGTWRDLGVPPGYTVSVLRGINSAGAAVGFTLAPPDWQAIWAPAGATSVQALTALPPNSFTHAVNDSGTMVGCSNSPTSGNRAFLYSNGSKTDLHGLLNAFGSSCARDVNNADVVVGEEGVPSRGFLYSNGGARRLDQGTSYLVNARAISSSSSAKVVGEGWRSGFSANHALVYDVATGAISSLGLETSAASESRPNDVNTAGDVVGRMMLPGLGYRAFLASAGQVLNLNDLIPAGSGWVLEEALSINDRGQIVGTGYLNNVSSYFLLNATSPQTAIGNLIAQVRALQAQGQLSKGSATALVAMLQVAEKLLRKSHTGYTVHALEVFVKHVDVLIRAGKLSASKGEPLIDEADRIIDLLLAR